MSMIKLSLTNSTFWFSNLTVLLLIVAAVFVVRSAKNNRMWREAFLELWKRRKGAIIIVGLYVFIGLADSVVWVGKGSVDDAVSKFETKSVIDCIFSDMKEQTYSAPLAKTEFGNDTVLRHPGKHLLGTNLVGEDVLYMTVRAINTALLLGGLSTLLVIPVAVLFGVSAGYWGGKLDDAIVFVMSVLSCIPGLLLLIVIIMAIGRGTLQVCVALAVTSWIGFCRMSRGETLKLREMDYVEAAKALGVSNFTIVLRHIIPNLGHLIIINFTLFFCSRILSETALAYLGIGIDGSWGQMIDQARMELSRDPLIWWNLASAFGAIFILILSVNLIGDAARDVFDPKTLKENE